MKRVWISPLFVALSAALLAALGPRAQAAEAFSLGKVQLPGWTVQGAVQNVVGQKLYDLIDGFADIHMGFAYIDSEHVKVQNGKKTLEVAVYREDTADNAYGLYTALRQRDGELVDLPDEASYSPGTLILWRGPRCVEVKDTGEESSAKDELVAVAKAITGQLAGTSQPPELVRALPKEKLSLRALLYFHDRHPLDQIYYMGTENVLMLSTEAGKPAKAEAAYATYQLAGGDQGLLAIRYADAASAKKAEDQYTDSLKKDVASVADEGPWRILTAKNGKKTMVFQKDRLLLIAIESSQADVVKPIVEKLAANLEPKKKKEAGEKKAGA